MRRSTVAASLVCAAAALAAAAQVRAQEDPPPARASRAPRVGVLGLHGGYREQLLQAAGPLGLELVTIDDGAVLAPDGVDRVAACDLVLLQHLQAEHAARWSDLLSRARAKNPRLRLLTCSGEVGGKLPKLGAALEDDAELHRYYTASPRNLRGLLVYARTRLLGLDGPRLEPPEEVRRAGLFHPDAPAFFDDLPAALAWIGSTRPALADAPRVAVVTHPGRLLLDNRAEAALVRALEARGVLALGVMDGRGDQALLRALGPLACIHTCHSADEVAAREALGVPHLHALFTRQRTIAELQAGQPSLSSSDAAFQIAGQEVTGEVEPLLLSAVTTKGGSEPLTPIPDRVDRVVERCLGWLRLARTPRAERRLAFIYYARSMGRGDLMRGSSSGMFLNAPRSMVRVLERLKAEGYATGEVPADEDGLLERLQRSGRTFGPWAAGDLDRLARGGEAALVPVDTYAGWLARRVPAAARAKLEAAWGPAPGALMVWTREDGARFLVVPRVTFGSVTLLPQPRRDDAPGDEDGKAVHDRAAPPPHHYLATYFWLEEELKAHALVHFGTHGSEFFLPGRPVGLGADDWCEQVVGRLPNLHPWIMNNVTESSPARRRMNSVLVDHLPPPSVNVDLPDALRNLHEDIERWQRLREAGGALADGFLRRIGEQARAEGLDRDLGLALPAERLPTPTEVERLDEHLHAIAEQPVNVDLHVLGTPPPDADRPAYLARCLGARFQDALPPLFPPPGDGPAHRARRPLDLATAVLGQLLRGLPPAEALVAAGATPTEPLPQAVAEGLATAQALDRGLDAAKAELDALVSGLDGRFASPGPAGGPDRNPAALPTGKNMYTINPDAVPSRPSWELGVRLTDELLAAQKAAKGRYPTKIAFSLTSGSTFLDHGVAEAQVLYLLGVRPRWDARDLVADVELIPRAELGRPRIDVLVVPLTHYRDILPSRLRLLDAAVRLAAAADEEDNAVRANTAKIEAELVGLGVDPARAALLAPARLFGRAPGEYGGPAVERGVMRSGAWQTRDDLAEAYLEQASSVFTDGAWGEPAPEAFRRAIQGTEVVLRSWADMMRTPLGDTYKWSQGGGLSLAVRHLTGKEPELLLSDVRDPGRARTVSAQDAVRRDLRARLLNRQWIEGMMKEGYAGADQVTAHVANAAGWAITREGSVTDEEWRATWETYLKDAQGLHVREWFEAENPWALQGVSELLLEALRHGLWRADRATALALAEDYARQVERRGHHGGEPAGGNARLQAFVKAALAERGATALLAAYERRLAELAAPGPAPGDVQAAAPPAPAAPVEAPDEAAPPAPPAVVSGPALEPVAPLDAARPLLPWAVGLAALLLLGAGFLRGGVR